MKGLFREEGPDSPVLRRLPSRPSSAPDARSTKACRDASGKIGNEGLGFPGRAADGPGHGRLLSSGASRSALEGPQIVLTEDLKQLLASASGESRRALVHEVFSLLLGDPPTQEATVLRPDGSVFGYFVPNEHRGVLTRVDGRVATSPTQGPVEEIVAAAGLQ